MAMYRGLSFFMPFYDPDVVSEAKKLDLLTYLQNYEPQELVHGRRYRRRISKNKMKSSGKTRAHLFVKYNLQFTITIAIIYFINSYRKTTV